MSCKTKVTVTHQHGGSGSAAAVIAAVAGVAVLAVIAVAVLSAITALIHAITGLLIVVAVLAVIALAAWLLVWRPRRAAAAAAPVRALPDSAVARRMVQVADRGEIAGRVVRPALEQAPSAPVSQAELTAIVGATVAATLAALRDGTVPGAVVYPASQYRQGQPPR